MSYNIHHGVGADGVFDIKRVAHTIKDCDADIVALQDVDRGTQRAGNLDLMTRLADLTGMTYTFAESGEKDGGEHGNGLLTRFPILEERPLLYHLQLKNRESGLMRLVLDLRGIEVLLMNTELNGNQSDSVHSDNVAEILGAAKDYPNVPVILCGSLNGAPDSKPTVTLSGSFSDCWTISGTGEGFTFPTSKPEYRYDYVFVSRPRTPTDSKTPGVRLEPIEAHVVQSIASDHLPVVATLRVVSQ